MVVFTGIIRERYRPLEKDFVKTLQNQVSKQRDWSFHFNIESEEVCSCSKRLFLLIFPFLPLGGSTTPVAFKDRGSLNKYIIHIKYISSQCEHIP